MKRVVTLVRSLPGWSSGLAPRCAWGFLFAIGFVAVFGPLIANEKPYYCKLGGQSYFPLFSSVSESGLSAMHPDHAPVSWKSTTFKSVWRTPVPYSHHTIDLKGGSYVNPFVSQAGAHRFRHWLGTDALGRDVLAGMIRGCRVSLLIGFGSMLLALLIGIPLGAAAAWWGNNGWRITWSQLAIMLISTIMIILVWYMPIPLRIQTVVSILLLISMIFLLIKTRGDARGNIPVQVDGIVMGWVSIIDGFPGIFLILILVAIVPMKGWVVVMLTIALLRWPSMARYMRAEVFKMKETNYIKAAQILNVPSRQILRRHIIPYAIRPVMISFIFGVSSAILAETSLSFLGIGLPTEEINWGRLLAQSRNHFDAWWLVVFPGFAIFFTLLSLYTIGNAWQKEKVGSMQ
jgi:peptide/nickel transport system permease protein